MLQVTVAALSGYPGMSNASMVVAAVPTDPFALMDVPIWDFDGTSIANIALVGSAYISTFPPTQVTDEDGRNSQRLRSLRRSAITIPPSRLCPYWR